MEAEAARSLADVSIAFRQDVFDVLALVTGEAREVPRIGGLLSESPPSASLSSLDADSQGVLDRLDAHRLGQIVVRAVLRGLHGRGDAPIPGQDDDPCIGAALL